MKVQPPSFVIDAVTQARTLKELAVALNFLDGFAREHGLRPEDYVDTTSLPVFGGPEPTATVGIWSWDERSFLRSDYRWFVEDRDDLAEAA